MTIGETIRHYRKKHQLTQAQLAQEVGVSIQAISKWETGAGCPDISQIIPLARSLHITTDTLLHFNDRREDFEKLWYETNERTHCDPRQMREVSRAALEVYPEDSIFLLRASVDEEQLALMAEDAQERDNHLRSALLHCRRQLRVDPEDGDAKIRMVRLLAQLGENDEAINIAYQCKGRDREIALKYCLKGEDLRRHRQKLVEKKLDSLLYELMEGDLGMLDAAEGIIRAAIPDGNFQHHYELLAHIFTKRFEYHRANGDMDAACAALRQVLELAKEADATQSLAFTAPAFDLLENINRENRPDRAERWLVAYVEMQLPQWREETGLAEIVNEAYAYLAEIAAQ